MVGGLSTTIYINTHMVLFGTILHINSVSYSPTLISASPFNILLLGYLMKFLFVIAVRKETNTESTEVGDSL
ncbi:MAG: hypothetical protein CVU90_04720 [Firmicutes bacterium HGW-Firmicutes-15]|nr:MAG: hypothetical protein CVU90_04720 [Firmicutes bacterium HGW-Firmicutes-15]